MLFSKAIQFKLWVNRVNTKRSIYGHKPIKFECGMFSIGNWYVNMSAPDGSIFYSHEIESMYTLISGNDITFWIGSNTFAPVLYFQ